MPLLHANPIDLPFRSLLTDGVASSELPPAQLSESPYMSETPETGPFGQPDPFGQIAPYAWPVAPPVDLRAVTGPAPVLMSFAGAHKQRRLTVGFRFILLIPQLIVLVALGVAAGVVVFIGWWAALFTGQLPRWAHDFLSGYLRWSARVLAYEYLLTDQYPPFSLEDADYPVRLLSKRTRLNRLAVFFRIIIAVPAELLAGIAVTGMLILSFFAWLITLVTGEMSVGLHEAFTAVVRFSTRYQGYLLLVTPEYPGGLLGDNALQLQGMMAEPAAAGDAGTPGLEPTVTFGAVPGIPAATPADPWRLVLSSSARKLVTVALAVGLLGYAGDIAGSIALASGPIHNAVQRDIANIKVSSSYSQLSSMMASLSGDGSQCGQNLSCVTSLDGQMAQAFHSFGTELRQADVPSSYSGEVAVLMADNSMVQNDYSQLAAAQSATGYSSLEAGGDLRSDLTEWQTAFNTLQISLSPQS
jgi:Domain of unknown function (DUF4389)